VATRPERRPRDQDRRGAARCRPVFSFGIGTKAVNRTMWDQVFTPPYLSNPVSPFHGEPLQIRSMSPGYPAKARFSLARRLSRSPVKGLSRSRISSLSAGPEAGLMQSWPCPASTFIQVLLRPPVARRPLFAWIAPTVPTALCTSPRRHERDTSPDPGECFPNCAWKPSPPH
jgi:hypothetical protein